MISGFADQGTEDVFNGNNTPAARRICPQALWSVAFRKLDQVDSAVELNDLAVPSGNRLEALRGNRAGKHSIRINDQWRICFVWRDGDAYEVEIVDYH